MTRWTLGRRLAKPANLVVFILSCLGVLFLISDRAGAWDQLRGIDQLEDLAARLDTSYAPVQRQVRPSDPEWNNVISLIGEYSRSKLPRDRTPKVLARYQALSSGFAGDQQNPIAEWTAPGTPIALIYVDWPTNDGTGVKPADIRIVGTIGDLHDWIRQKRDSFRFWVYDVFWTVVLAVCAVAVM